MKRNNLYLDRLIRKSIMEQNETIPLPPTSGAEDIPAPPTQNVVKYNIVGKDGKTDPTAYTVEELKTKNLKADSYIYTKSLGGWKMVKDVPEVNGAIASSNPTTDANSTKEPTGEEKLDEPIEGTQKSFMEYCPNAKKLRDTTLNAYNKQMETELAKAENVEEVNATYDKFTGYQGQFDKDKFLKPCMSELKVTLKGQPDLIMKYESAFNQWMSKDGKELAKKALSTGGNILLKLANNALKAKGLGSITENIIKRKTKNHLIEIYNRKNRRRY